MTDPDYHDPSKDRTKYRIAVTMKTGKRVISKKTYKTKADAIAGTKKYIGHSKVSSVKVVGGV